MVSRDSGLISIPERVFSNFINMKKNKPDANSKNYSIQYTFPVSYIMLCPLQLLVQLRDTEGISVSQCALAFPQCPGQDRVPAPPRSRLLKAGVLLPPLAAGNKG